MLRLASLLWRMRRASPIETDLFQIQAEILSDPQYEYETGIGPRITERLIKRFDHEPELKARIPQRLWRSLMSNLGEVAYRIDPALWVRHILGVEPTKWHEDFLRAPRGAPTLATARQHDRHVGQNNSASIVPERPSESLFEDRPIRHHRAHSIVLDAC